MRQSPSVLIIGAGALGVATGYHLTLSGVRVTYYVRPARLPQASPPQTLYCYDDAQLKVYSDYRLVSQLEELTGSQFDFVLVTLDGASCKSKDGTVLLKTLGGLIGGNAAFIIAGVGVRQHCIDCLNRPPEQVVEGTQLLLSYQVDRAAFPIYPPTNAEQLAQSTIGYRHISGKSGFMISGEPGPVASAFAKLYNGSGVSKCVRIPPRIFGMISTSLFPLFAICDLAGWPKAKQLAEKQELLELGSAAMREILSMRGNGLRGKLLSLMLSSRVLLWMITKMEKSALPFDFHAFNQFHHGGKVRLQDIQVMEDCLRSGQNQRHQMPALEELLTRYRKHCGLV